MGLATDGVRQGGSSSFIKFMLLVLVVLLFPLMILLVGAPIALALRVLIEIAHRLQK